MGLALVYIAFVATYNVANTIMHRAKPTVVHSSQRVERCIGPARQAGKNTPHPLKILGKTAACLGEVGPGNAIQVTPTLLGLAIAGTEINNLLQP